MSDSEKAVDAPPGQKGRPGRIIVMAAGAIVLVGGGFGAGLYAAGSAMVGSGASAHAREGNKPRLVPKSEQKHPADAEGGGESGDGAAHAGQPVPAGEGGDRYASNYYAMDKEFTANLQDSVHFIQVGVAISTPYDDTVIQNLRTNDIAIRSAVLMTLGDTTEDQVFTSQGKEALAKRLVASINRTLEQKEGFGGVRNVYFTNFVVQ